MGEISVTWLAVLWLAAAGQIVVPPSMDEGERQRQAHVLLDEALKRYNASDYEAAIESFKAAYALAPAPGLLFNIAQAYRLAGKGHCLEAARTYRSYLDASPQASNREKVEVHLKSLEPCLKEEERSAGSDLRTPRAPADDAPTVTRVEPLPASPAPVDVVREAPPATVVTSHPSHHSPWPPLGIGLAGAVALAVGAGLYVWSGEEYSGFQKQCPNADCSPSLWMPARTHEQVGIAMLCVGAGAVVAAALWWLFSSGDGS